MPQQLITIDERGAVSGLQFKSGKGLDLRKLGRAEIIRSSLIEWSEAFQMWYIKLLHFKKSEELGELVTDRLWAHGLGEEAPLPAQCRCNERGDDGILFFEEYEDAVTAEVELIQALRLKFGDDSV